MKGLGKSPEIVQVIKIYQCEYFCKIKLLRPVHHSAEPDLYKCVLVAMKKN